MSLFKKKPKTAQQKAQMTQMRILTRVACCAYIVFYVIVPLLKPSLDGAVMNPALRIGIAAAFIAAVVAILAVTAKEAMRTWKAGLFKADAYTDDEVQN